MIRIGQILPIIADAIEQDAAVTRLCERWPDAMTVSVGMPASNMSRDGKGPCIGLYFDDPVHDLGHSPKTRLIPVGLDFALFDNEADSDGRRTTYVGMIAADELAVALVAAIKAIDGLGDELSAAEYRLTGEEWPIIRGTIALSFDCQRGTAYEPEIT